jgi:long-chain acyl-CoA synthetase
VRTPALSAGYADGSGAMDDRMTPDGWFRTGDLGSIDTEGFVWIEGRVSDQINRGGMKVTPSEVEEVLGAADGVQEAAVVGAPDDRLGEVPVAFVVAIDAARPPDAATLEAHCREHLAPWKVPVRFEPIDTLPRNEVGKVMKRELLERADA